MQLRTADDTQVRGRAFLPRREGRFTTEMLQSCGPHGLRRGEAVARDRQEVALLLHCMADRRERPSQLGVRITPEHFCMPCQRVQDDGELPAHQRYIRIRRFE